MKFTLRFVAAIIAMLAVSAPATAQNTTLTQELAARGIYPATSMAERCMREGRPYGPGGNGSVAVATGAVNTVIAVTGNTPVGYMPYVESFDAALYPRPDGATQPTNPIRFQILQTADAALRFPQVLRTGVVPATGGNSGSVPYGQVIRPINSGLAGLTLAVRDNGSSGSVTFTGTVSIVGCVLTDDPNWTAPRIMLMKGDSTCAGSSGATSKGMWEFLARDYVKYTLAKDIRLVLRCVSGANAADHVGYDAQGWYDVGPNIAFIGHRLGVNDAAQAVSGPAFVASMVTDYTRARQRSPNADLWYFGPTPLLNTTYEASAVVIRNAMAAQVATWRATDSKVHYCNLGTAWTPTDATKTSDGIHYPTETSELLVWNVVQACFQAAGGINVN